MMATCICAPKFATPTYLPTSDAQVQARIVGPDGSSQSVDLHPDSLEQGVYTADWDAGQAGSYVAEITATRGQQELGRDVITFRREDGVAENFHLEQNRDLLEKLSSQTGGRYYRPDRSQPAGRGHFVFRRRHHGARNERSVGHADRILPGAAAVLHRVGAAPKMGCGMRKFPLLLIAVLACRVCSRPPRSTSPSRASAASPITSSASHPRPRRSTSCCTPPVPTPRSPRCTAPQATKANLQNALAQVARDAKPNDAFVLMLIGHGSFDGYEYKINLPGPDISGVELAALLDRIGCTRQLVVNMTSASGGSRAALEKANRVVITATKSGNEKNATVFARFWVEALRDPAADTDKNETVSALEAFIYAETKTAQFYDTQKRLATEHPILEDTGQGDGERNLRPKMAKD